jgi:hypothetical protein
LTPNGNDIAVALCTNDPSEEAPPSETIQQSLGSLGKRLVWTTRVSPEAWTTRKKGTVDREAMIETLTETFQSG